MFFLKSNRFGMHLKMWKTNENPNVLLAQQLPIAQTSALIITVVEQFYHADRTHFKLFSIRIITLPLYLPSSLHCYFFCAYSLHIMGYQLQAAATRFWKVCISHHINMLAYIAARLINIGFLVFLVFCFFLPIKHTLSQCLNLEAGPGSDLCILLVFVSGSGVKSQPHLVGPCYVYFTSPVRSKSYVMLNFFIAVLCTGGSKKNCHSDTWNSSPT